MQDPITLIEKIQQNQAELANDLELLKGKESEQFVNYITALQQHQQCFAEAVAALQLRIQNEREKGGEK